MEISNALKRRRLDLGLTLKEVASIINTSESTISRYESMNIQELSVDKIVALAKALECSPSELLGWSDEEKKMHPDQMTIFEDFTTDIINANVYEAELIRALRTLKETSRNETDMLYYVFTTIPALPEELRRSICEEAYRQIRKHERERIKQQYASKGNDVMSNQQLLNFLGIDNSQDK